MKKALSIILSLVMILAAFPLTGITSFASYDEINASGKCGKNVIYNFNEQTGELIISGSGDMYNYSSAKNYYSPFYGNIVIKSVVIEEGVTSIGFEAFYRCWFLDNIVIADSVTLISAYAFEACQRLKTVTIGNGAETIKSFAFKDCRELTTVDYNGTEDEWNAIDISMNGNGYLWSVKPQTKVKTGTCGYGVGYSFNGATGVLNIYSTASSNCTMFNNADQAFWNNKSITSVVMSGNVADIGIQAFSGCENLESIQIGPYVKEIKQNAFQNTGLTYITIPAGVTYVDPTAFVNCYNLASIAVASGNSVYDCRNNCKAIIETATNTLVVGCKNTVIPSGVTAVGDNAFFGCSGLKSINIPAGVTSIGDFAFYFCTFLENITIPDSVTSIGSSAFSQCIYLHIPFDIPSGVTEIKAGTFRDCGITSINIHDGVTSIGNYAFYDCDTIESVDIPASVKTIGNEAFRSCSKLSSVNISAGVESIGSEAFRDCNKLESIIIPDSVTSIDYGAFYECKQLTKATLPDGITSVDNVLFAECSKLKTVIIPGTVTSIGAAAFRGCDKLSDVYFSGSESEWQSISKSAANDALDSAAIHYYSGACGSDVIYEYSQNTGKLTLTGTGAVYDYPTAYPGFYAQRSGITSIEVSEGITAIGTYAFYNLTAVTAVTIPSSVTEIRASAFNSCGSISDVYYTGSFTDWNSIIKGAYNTSLTNATLHIAVTGVCGDNATYSYNSDNGVLAIKGTGDMYSYESDYAPWHDYRSSIRFVTIADGITSIGGYAFGDTNIESYVDIPESVTAIGSRAFQNCRNMIYVDIPGGVISIGDSAFEGCSGLTEITVPETLTDLGSFAFMNCTGLTEAVIPESLTEISTYAFYNCTALESIEVPCSVTEIEEYAFDGCSALSDVYYHGTRSEWFDIDIGYHNTWLEDAKLHCEIDNASGEDNDDVTWSFNPNTGVLTISGEGAMEDDYFPWHAYYKQVKTVIIEDGITYIGTNVFLNHTKLESVIIGSGVTEIGECAFELCNKLTDVSYHGTESEWNSINIGSYNDQLTNASITFEQSGSSGSNITYIFDPRTGTLTINGTGDMSDVFAPWGNSSAAAWRNDVKKVVIGNGIIHIGDDAFIGNKNIETVIFGSDVTSLGNAAFDNCSKIKNVFFDGSEAQWNSITNEGGNATLYNARIHFSEAGICGDNATYALSRLTGVLTIRGTGAIYDYAVDSPFDSNNRIEAVEICEGITRVGDWTFNSCSGIKSVSMPSTLTSIGDDAFRVCTGLTDVSIPDSVTTIGDRAFTQCSGLVHVTLPNSLTTLGDYAFSSCDSLAQIRIPGSLTNFGSYAFRYCTALESLNIEGGLTTIGNSAFQGCTSLERFYMPMSVTTVSPLAFAGCTALQSINMGGGLTTIGNGAFNNCNSLKQINWYNSVESWYNVSIGNTNNPIKNAIKHCESNTETGEMYYYTSPCGASSYWLLNINTGALAIKGSGAMTDYEFAKAPYYDGFREDIKTVTFDSGITSIGNYAFCNCTELTGVTIPDTVTTIGSAAFEICPALSSISIPSSVTSIGREAFFNCESLTNIVIPSGITEIAISTFYGCSALTSVTIPVSVTNIGNFAFDKCNALATVNYPGSENDWYAVTIGEYNDPLLKAKPQLRTGSCGDNVTYSFDKATGVLTISGTGPMYDLALSTIPWFDVRLDIKGLVIKPGVTSIGNHAFAASVNMVYAVIPETVTSIVSNAFVTCNKLEYIVCYEDSFAATFDTAKTTYLGDVDMSGGIGQSDYALIRNKLSSNFNSLSAIQLILADYDIDGAVDAFDMFMLDKTMNGLPLYSFSYTALSGNNVQITGFGGRGVDIVVPATINGYTVTEVGNYAFKNNNQIQNVRISNGITKVMYGTFLNCKQLRTVELANSVTSIGSYCFKDCTNLTSVKIPASVTTIQATAFTNCPNVTIYGAAGSYAQTFANNNSITFVAVT